jgi:protein-L-isoaspartate(D-aspartate) O-methyltransferase
MKSLADQLTQNNILKSEPIRKAFLSIDRKAFIPDEMKALTYQDSPLAIGCQQTISAPHMVVMMLELLQIKPDMSLLEIGTGSGYNAALMSKLVGSAGQVHTLERIQALADKAQNKLKPYTNVKVYHADGYDGLPQEAPFDIIVSTCVANAIPETWVKQIKDDGKLLMPIEYEHGNQQLILGDMIQKELKLTPQTWVRFVPMLEGIDKKNENNQ